MRWPAGRSVSTTRDVKSEVSSAAGPRTRRGSAKRSVVAYSTNMRAVRSVRLQITARPPPTSPAVTPDGSVGRAPVRVTIAGRLPESSAKRQRAS